MSFVGYRCRGIFFLFPQHSSWSYYHTFIFIFTNTIVGAVVNSIFSFIQSINQDSTPVFTQDQFYYVQQNKGIVTDFFTNGLGSGGGSVNLGSEYQYLNEFGQKQVIFDGAGTILSVAIDIAGPGIVSVIIEEVATYIFNNIVMPIITSISGTSLLDIVNSLFGTSDTSTSGNGISFIVENFISLFDFSNVADIIGSAINGVSDFAGSLFDGFLNWFIEIGNSFFNAPEIINIPIYSDIFGLINTIVLVVDNIFNIAPEHFNEMKNVGLAIADELMNILKIKASLPETKSLIEFMKLSFDFESMGLALYDVCDKLLNDGITFPQKVLFSLLWMIKIMNSFTGSVLSFFHDFFNIYASISGIDMSIFPQLESYTIILNIALETAIYLFFQVIFNLNNILSFINVPEFIIISTFFVAFTVKNFLLFKLKSLEIEGTSKEIIRLKEETNIKISIILEMVEIGAKIAGILSFN